MAQPLKKAFKCAGEGVIAAFGERNMKIHLCFAAAAIVLNIVLQVDTPSWLAVLLCIGAVLSLECMNTALEALVDLASPQYHNLAKRAKDCAAGAVFIAALISLIVAALIYIPQMGNLLC